MCDWAELMEPGSNEGLGCVPQLTLLVLAELKALKPVFVQHLQDSPQPSPAGATATETTFLMGISRMPAEVVVFLGQSSVHWSGQRHACRGGATFGAIIGALEQSKI